LIVILIRLSVVLKISLLLRILHKFTCAYCDFLNWSKHLADGISEAITATTAVTKWTGERMDLSMAVDGLLWASDGRLNHSV
jgi:hypothetical protein